MKKHLKTAIAYSMRVELQDIYEQSASRSKAENRLKDYRDEILNYFDYQYTNAILEGTNSIIQNIKCRARGFRNDEYFKTMIYLIRGQQDLDSVIAAV